MLEHEIEVNWIRAVFETNESNYFLDKLIFALSNKTTRHI